MRVVSRVRTSLSRQLAAKFPTALLNKPPALPPTPKVIPTSAPAASQGWKTYRNEQAGYSLGNVLDAQGKSMEATAFFEAALRRRPDSPETRNGLGLALAAQGKIPQAVAQYEAVLRDQPAFVEAHINLGQLLAQQGKPEAALAEYSTALRLNSNSVAAHINL